MSNNPLDRFFDSFESVAEPCSASSSPSSSPKKAGLEQTGGLLGEDLAEQVICLLGEDLAKQVICLLGKDLTEQVIGLLAELSAGGPACRAQCRRACLPSSVQAGLLSELRAGRPALCHEQVIELFGELFAKQVIGLLGKGLVIGLLAELKTGRPALHEQVIDLLCKFFAKQVIGLLGKELSEQVIVLLGNI
ncbi:hypothetical protein PCASD_22758 [Puccinia coronata f. sp. avenae]|uniref:Uncharacterized protein n=1 Tax=Puccinia coronata f. sp. avenae TaxID=200324 RepID=A0A2N5S4A0_9BASI|nr:hypothetical protein PCASD_22758 [Puccinia coronata f. sp. avenae]